MTTKLTITNKKSRLFLGASLLALVAIFIPPAMAVEVCGLEFVWIESEPDPVDIACATGDIYAVDSTVNLRAGGAVSNIYGMGESTINVYGGTITGYLNFASTALVTVYATSAEIDYETITDEQEATTNDAEQLEITQTYIKNIGPSTIYFNLIGTYQDETPFVITCALEPAATLGLNIPNKAPEIEVLPALLHWDLGNVKVGESATVIIQIFNYGTADLNVSSVTLTGDADFSLTSGPVIDPNDPSTLLVIAPNLEISVDYEVTFTPSADGLASAVVRIVSDDEDESVVEVVLTGVGTSPEIAVEPASLDLGQLDVGTSAAQSMTIANYGDAQLIINSLTWTEDSSADFAIAVLPELPLVIEPNSTVELSIVYTPTTIGAAAATLEISSNDPEKPLVTLAVAGIGVYPPLRQINDIIAFYDESVQNGTIQGVGPGKSAQAHIRVIKEVLLITKCLIQSKYQRLAIVALMEIDKFTDGKPRPSDIITGPAVAELNTKINTLITTLKTH